MRLKLVIFAAISIGLGTNTSLAQADGEGAPKTADSAMGFADREAQPVTPPNVRPLQFAMNKIRKPAKCEVAMDVDTEGKPINISGKCDVSGYVKAVEKAMKSARFAPKMKDNNPVVRKGVVYPFDLKMNVPEKLPECAKQKTSKKERVQLTEVRDAVNARDAVALEVALGNIKREKLFCTQAGLLDTFLVRQHMQDGQWEEAQSLLESINTYQNGRINDTIVSAYAKRYQQWISDLDAVKVGLINKNRGPQLLIPACMDAVYDAHSKHKVDETCLLQYDLDELGLVSKIEAACETPAYVEATKQAARCLVFLPAIKNEKAAPSLENVSNIVFEKRPKLKK